MTNVYALLPRLRCSRSRPAKKLGDRNLAVFPSTADTFGTLLDPRFRDVGKYISSGEEQATILPGVLSR